MLLKYESVRFSIVTLLTLDVEGRVQEICHKCPLAISCSGIIRPVLWYPV